MLGGQVAIKSAGQKTRHRWRVDSAIEVLPVPTRLLTPPVPGAVALWPILVCGVQP